MVLKFKVWRLQWERRGKPKRKEGKRTKVLVLRDKSGRIRKIATTEYEQFKLRKWYKQYNVGERLERLLETQKLKEHVRRVKQRIRRRGFTFQISLYGITTNPKTNKHQYRRYEIFKASKWLPDEVGFLHHFFKTHVPKAPAGVFVFHDNKLFVDERDTMTKFIPKCICGRTFKTEQALEDHIKHQKYRARSRRAGAVAHARAELKNASDVPPD